MTRAAQWQVVSYGGPYVLRSWTLAPVGDAGMWTLTNGVITREIGPLALYSAIDVATSIAEALDERLLDQLLRRSGARTDPGGERL